MGIWSFCCSLSWMTTNLTEFALTVTSEVYVFHHMSSDTFVGEIRHMINTTVLLHKCDCTSLEVWKINTYRTSFWKPDIINSISPVQNILFMNAISLSLQQCLLSEKYECLWKHRNVQKKKWKTEYAFLYTFNSKTKLFYTIADTKIER